VSESSALGGVMSKPIVQILVLAAMSDNQFHDEEKALLNNYKNYYPTIRNMTQEEFNQECAAVFTKKEAGMRDAHIVEVLGEQLSENEKNTAYGLAVEVCASNYEIVPPETDFIKCIEEQWKIKKKVIEAVRLSSQIRYSVS